MPEQISPGWLRVANTTQQIKDLRLRRGVIPKAVHAYDEVKQRRIRGGVSGSKVVLSLFGARKRQLNRVQGSSKAVLLCGIDGYSHQRVEVRVESAGLPYRFILGEIFGEKGGGKGL